MLVAFKKNFISLLNDNSMNNTFYDDNTENDCWTQEVPLNKLKLWGMIECISRGTFDQVSGTLTLKDKLTGKTSVYSGTPGGNVAWSARSIYYIKQISSNSEYYLDFETWFNEAGSLTYDKQGEYNNGINLSTNPTVGLTQQFSIANGDNLLNIYNAQVRIWRP